MTARDGHAIISAMTPSPRHRPLGLTLIAVLFLLEAIAALGLAAFLLLSPTGATAYGALFDRLEWPAALSSLLAVPPLLTAGLAGLVFRGLWNQASWARMAALVVSFLFILLIIAGLAFLAAFAALDSGRIIAATVGLIVSGLAFLYLLRVRIDEQPAGLAPTVAPESVAGEQPAASAVPAPAYIERAPAAAPPSALAAPPIPVVTVGVAGALVPPPPRANPSQQAGTNSGGNVRGDAFVYDANTLASAPSTQQIVAGPSPTATQAVAWLSVRSGSQLGQSFPILSGETLLVGRDPARATAVLSEPTVSALHAQIRQEQGRFVIYDLGSTNGTYLGNEAGYTAAIQRQPLQDGDELRLGSVSLLFTIGKP